MKTNHSLRYKLNIAKTIIKSTLKLSVQNHQIQIPNLNFRYLRPIENEWKRKSQKNARN